MDTSVPQPDHAIEAGYSVALAYNVPIAHLTKLESMMREIAVAGQAKPSTYLAYAAAYANAYLAGQRNRVQIAYTRANLSGWRGDRAREIRVHLDYILNQTELR